MSQNSRSPKVVQPRSIKAKFAPRHVQVDQSIKMMTASKKKTPTAAEEFGSPADTVPESSIYLTRGMGHESRAGSGHLNLRQSMEPH